MRKIRVLIIDDSILMRRLITEVLSSDPAIEVVGTSTDPYGGWDAIHELTPDVITLDVEMPRMDGLDFLERLMRARPMPVIMVSSLTERNSETTLHALSLGAVDCVAKPKLEPGKGFGEAGHELIAKVKAAANARVRVGRVHRSKPPERRVVGAPAVSSGGGAWRKIVAIGSSTGGTEALSEVLSHLPSNSPGIVIVQHMPENFTRRFAERLNRDTALRAAEATDGAAVEPGLVLIAPGSTHHMKVERGATGVKVRVFQGPPVKRHRPSVDVLFQSCAEHLGARAVGVILTGMGDDGADGLLAMRQKGSTTIAQNEATCVVFGMPREAIARGAAVHIVALERIADAILKAAGEPAHSLRP